MKCTYIVISIYLLITLAKPTIQSSLRVKRQNAPLEFPQLAQKYGLKAEVHNVTTEDGYIVTMFHIPGNKTKPVLVMHGLLDSADTYILRGRKSLAATLANTGYDAWFGNFRGNKYARQHVKLNPDTSKQFWDFSYHQVGVYDLPAMIDYILRKNGVDKLSLIGHSLGNTIFYVMGSEKPEYNDKINVAIALAPVCFTYYRHYQTILSHVFSFGSIINRLLLDMNQEELFGKDFFLLVFKDALCRMRGVGYRLCATGIIADVGGLDVEEFEPEFYYYALDHFPSGTSRKNIFHLLQMGLREDFAKFDYGEDKNIKIYNSKTSPSYDLGKVTMKVALIVGKNDKFTPVSSVSMLKDSLPNVVDYYFVKREKFNHLDHIWGRHMYKLLFPHLLKILETHS